MEGLCCSQRVITPVADAVTLCIRLKRDVGSWQRRRSFGERVLSIFSVKVAADIFDFYSSGTLGRKKFVPRGWASVKRKERGGGGAIEITSHFPAPSLTVHSNSESTIASWITDRDLLTLTHRSKTPALQAGARVELNPLVTSILAVVFSGVKFFFDLNTFNHPSTRDWVGSRWGGVL